MPYQEFLLYARELLRTQGYSMPQNDNALALTLSHYREERSSCLLASA
jgi:hypothetical protein